MMNNLNNNQFSIEKTTMRELTTVETEAVGGGPATTVSSRPCVGITIRIIEGVTTLFTGGDDGIFDDGFDEQP